MPDETAITATTTNPISQHGGKYADHEFVKIASKVIKGVEREPYNKFETILVNYDKMKEIKGKRNLTKTEQRIYDRTDKLIKKEFDAMFKKADTMLDQLDRKIPAQKGGAAPPLATDATVNKSSPHPVDNGDPAAAANANANTVSNAAAAAAPAPSTGEDDEKGNKTIYRDSNRFYRWVISLLKGIWDWIIGLFTGAFIDKFAQLRKQFSADELFKQLGDKPDEKIEKLTGAFKDQVEKLQRLVATGIGGAASASIDMILNAFSMSPVFGTTILVWRMFQNMLMIMGASLSVQAADSTFSTRAATLADPTLAAAAATTKTQEGGGKAKAKNNVTKRLKTDIRQLNRSLKRYMHFPHHRKGTTMSGGGAGSGYSYT